jgi:hypothetical protein
MFLLIMLSFRLLKLAMKSGSGLPSYHTVLISMKSILTYVVFRCSLQTLQEKFDKHPEVTHAKVEMERLLDELDRYKTFCDLGERDVLVQENVDLRNHLQMYLECGTLDTAKNRQFSITSRAVRNSVANLCLPSVANPATESEESQDKNWAEEHQLLQGKESEWLSLMDELADESEKFRQLAEKRKLEIDGEKRYMLPLNCKSNISAGRL